MLHLISMLGALQQEPAASSPAAPPIAKVTIAPAEVALQVGDTVRLTVTAEDSSGRRIRGVKARWFQSGGFFEGRVDSTGLVTGGSTGTLAVSALVSAGGGPPATGFARVTVLPQPAAKIVFDRPVPQLYSGQSLIVSATPYAANDDRRYDQVLWSSDAPAVVMVSPTGRLTAGKPGRARITARAGRATGSFPVSVAPNPVATLRLEPATTSVRTGDVVRLAFQASTRAGRAVSGVTPEWALSPGNAQIEPDGHFVADVPGTYRVLATFAGKTTEAMVDVRPRDVRRPTTLVGRLPIEHRAAEFWLHPDGRHGYLSTIGDRMYAIDLSNPATPRITDSVIVDARAINDVMTTEDGKYGVLTRENASTRKNGIVILSFEDPAHPKPIAEFTETVTGGVHSTFVYRGYVYLTDDATGSLRVIDIRDPYKPRQVARWQTRPDEAGNVLHDVDVKDGLAYLSYWNQGLVILDVGNGIKGGSPENPQLVSQYKYDLNSLYRDVEAVGGPGFIRGTHTAWRAGKYVFVGDEVFSARPRGTEGGGVIGLGRAYGRLHVIDVSDIHQPKEVAYYEPKDGGSHNVWVAGDTLYLGDYQGGLRILDISGDLRGDLQRQGREIAHVVTGDAAGVVPNASNAWGAIYRDGLIYVPDINSGLWIVRVEAKSELVP
ncbi:MAG TPA: Ig-like domain-containing protein [Gemmatimonadales bacterium]|nr:Ig-like domain-containing protein [Gemmatimonadales bacterium]